MALINIEIAYALPDHYYLKSFAVEEGTMVQTAILQSGILQQFTEIDLRENKVGVFSRPVKLNDPLKEGDRIEIYRPLLADPKEIRRKRAEQQAQEQKLKAQQAKAEAQQSKREDRSERKSQAEHIDAEKSA